MEVTNTFELNLTCKTQQVNSTQRYIGFRECGNVTQQNKYEALLLWRRTTLEYIKKNIYNRNNSFKTIYLQVQNENNNTQNIYISGDPAVTDE